MHQRPLFISVEGIDGAGKSTHIAFIKDHLIKHGRNVVLTREPGGTKLGEEIRHILLNRMEPMHRITELYLMFAARQELIHQIIVPSLENGSCVVADRFVDSSVAYQGYGRQIGQTKLNAIISILEPQIMPDLTLVFDVDVEIALGRLSDNKSLDRIEQEGRDFFTHVQKGYHALSQNEPSRVKIINTYQSIENTQAQIVQYLDPWMS